MAQRTPGFDTLAIHAGAQPDPATGARATPIYQTTSYVFEDADHAASLFGLQAFGNIYTRIMNPTQAVLEERVAALEGGTAALAVASGHAAQFIVFHTIMRAGENFIAARKLYGGSINQFGHSFKSFDWKVRWADPDDPSTFESQIDDKTRAIFVESIANPGGIVVDIAAIARIAHEHGIPLIVDNTHGQPLSDAPDRARRRHRRPFADQVHRRPRQFHGRRHRRRRHLRLVEVRQLSDAVGAASRIWRHGAARDLRQFRLRHRRARARPARFRPGDLALQRLHDPDRHRDPAAQDAEALRQRACRRRMAVGASRPWPGCPMRRLPGDKYHELQQRYSPKGGGAVFTFGLKGGYEAGVKFVEGLEMFSHLANIGDTRSLVIHPASTTHRQLSDEQKVAAGAGPDVVRLSIGIEDVEDIIADLDQALAKV